MYSWNIFYGGANYTADTLRGESAKRNEQDNAIRGSSLNCFTTEGWKLFVVCVDGWIFREGKINGTKMERPMMFVRTDTQYERA